MILARHGEGVPAGWLHLKTLSVCGRNPAQTRSHPHRRPSLGHVTATAGAALASGPWIHLPKPAMWARG